MEENTKMQGSAFPTCFDRQGGSKRFYRSTEYWIIIGNFPRVKTTLETEHITKDWGKADLDSVRPKVAAPSFL